MIEIGCDHICEKCANKEPENWSARFLEELTGDDGLERWRKKMADPAYTMTKFDKAVATLLLQEPDLVG